MHHTLVIGITKHFAAKHVELNLYKLQAMQIQLHVMVMVGGKAVGNIDQTLINLTSIWVKWAVEIVFVFIFILNR